MHTNDDGEEDFLLLKKRFASSYADEAIHYSFSAEENRRNGLDFEYSYALYSCTAEEIENCVWDEEPKNWMKPDHLYYNEEDDTYDWLIFLPENVVPGGTHIRLYIYGFNHEINLHYSPPYHDLTIME